MPHMYHTADANSIKSTRLDRGIMFNEQDEKKDLGEANTGRSITGRAKRCEAIVDRKTEL